MALAEVITNIRIGRESIFRDHTDLRPHHDAWLVIQFKTPRAVILKFWAELAPVSQRETRSIADASSSCGQCNWKRGQMELPGLLHEQKTLNQQARGQVVKSLLIWWKCIASGYSKTATTNVSFLFLFFYKKVRTAWVRAFLYCCRCYYPCSNCVL